MKNNYFILMLTFIQFSCTSVPTEMLNKPEYLLILKQMILFCLLIILAMSVKPICGQLDQ